MDTKRRLTSKPAKGTRGFLCLSLPGKEPFFRIYGKKKRPEGGRDFKDYEIHHFDIQIRIDDDSAYFYEDGSKRFIDYPPHVVRRFRRASAKKRGGRRKGQKK